METRVIYEARLWRVQVLIKGNWQTVFTTDSKLQAAFNSAC